MGDIIRLGSRYNKGKMQGTMERAVNQTGSDQSRNYIFNTSLSPVDMANYIRRSFHQNADEPFPVVSYANKLGVDVFVEDFSEIRFGERLKGYLAIKPNGKDVIVVNKDESYGHQRWTVAHELWHFFMNKKSLPPEKMMVYTELNDYSSHSDEELAADRFASELLMPEHEFREIYHFYGAGEKDIARSALAEHFVVSRTAVAKRISDLNL